jgi:hypothetical protein
MFLSHEQLKQALAALHEARRQGRHTCGEPRVDAQGRGERPVQPPKRRDGRQATAFTLDYGAHGADFLQVDPVTGEIRCGACAGELDATVKA